MLGHPGAQTPHQAFYYYRLDQLQAVRSGPWKLYVRLGGSGSGSQERLYDVVKDPGETMDQASGSPAIVKRLNTLADIARRELGDKGKVTAARRKAGMVAEPKAQRLTRD